MMISERVARAVQTLRRQRGMNRDELAAACQRLGAPKMTAASITNIETGRPQAGARRRAVTVDELTVFAEVFSLEPADLLNDPCTVCHGAPPPGFICKNCGKTTEEAG